LVDLSTLASLFPFLHIFKATDVALVWNKCAGNKSAAFVFYHIHIVTCNSGQIFMICSLYGLNFCLLTKFNFVFSITTPKTCSHIPEYVIRPAMERYEIHVESCLHIQQDEDNVCVTVRVLPKLYTLPGSVLRTDTTKGMQDREG
jgi:hypothetical protein